MEQLFLILNENLKKEAFITIYRSNESVFYCYFKSANFIKFKAVHQKFGSF